PRVGFHGPPVAASAAVGRGFRRGRGPPPRRADRPRRPHRKPARADPAPPADGHPRHGPGRPRASSAECDGGRGVERPPAPPAPADPLRCRRRHHFAGPSPRRPPTPSPSPPPHPPPLP